MIREGAVACRGGRIVGVGSALAVHRAFPSARQTDLGRSVLLPGLVNAHVHLELSALSRGAAPGRFIDWLKRLIPTGPIEPAAVSAFVEKGVAIGVEQCRRFGVTTVGDISRHCALTRRLLAGGPLDVVSFGEVQAMARRRIHLEARIASAAESSAAGPFVRVGLSPHAPYSVETTGYGRCLEAARHAGLPLATHLAETPDETPFLADHSGPFRELWAFIGDWDDRVPTFAGGPIRMAKSIGLLDGPSLLAHVNYCDDEEMQLLAEGQASVVYCPRTHAWFGHPPHRFGRMLALGINVALGTDSCASSPDLNLLDDARLAHMQAPELPADAIWQMVTLRAARAIGLGSEVGSLTVGKRANLVAFNVRTDQPLDEILQNDALPVWSAA